MIRLYRQMLDLDIKLFGFLPDKAFEIVCNIVNQHRKAVLRRPNEMIVQVANPPGCVPITHTQEYTDTLYTTQLLNKMGGVRGFLCQLKQTVPAA